MGHIIKATNAVLLVLPSVATPTVPDKKTAGRLVRGPQGDLVLPRISLIIGTRHGIVNLGGRCAQALCELASGARHVRFVAPLRVLFFWLSSLSPAARPGRSGEPVSAVGGGIDGG
jgi:hypothetical protein